MKFNLLGKRTGKSRERTGVVRSDTDTGATKSKDMELYNGKYCGTYEDFAGIMTAKAIQHRVQRGQIEQARRACIGTPALFVVDSFPTKERVEVYRRYPDLQAQAESKPFIDSITPDGVAAQFYADYKIDDVRGLNYDKQIEYTNNASILAAFRSVIERADSPPRERQQTAFAQDGFLASRRTSLAAHRRQVPALAARKPAPFAGEVQRVLSRRSVEL